MGGLGRSGGERAVGWSMVFLLMHSEGGKRQMSFRSKYFWDNLIGRGHFYRTGNASKWVYGNHMERGGDG